MRLVFLAYLNSQPRVVDLLTNYCAAIKIICDFKLLCTILGYQIVAINITRTSNVVKSVKHSSFGSIVVKLL